MALEYQYVRCNELVEPGQTLIIENLCITDDQTIEVSCEGSDVTILSEGRTSTDAGIDISSASGWVILVDTDSAVFRKFRVWVTNRGVSNATFSLRCSCSDAYTGPSTTTTTLSTTTQTTTTASTTSTSPPG
jgi:hypothetical protein